jgi:hypothetical protein
VTRTPIMDTAVVATGGGISYITNTEGEDVSFGSGGWSNVPSERM